MPTLDDYLQGIAQEKRELENLKIVCAALVHMLGGAVHISQPEIEYAYSNLVLTNEFDRDHVMIVLKTEPKIWTP